MGFVMILPDEIAVRIPTILRRLPDGLSIDECRCI